ncbi:hypothetical protein [Pleomorphovibrio marinus]|uniref:hypothetical protein n=1 Tax=Pleomorphovibrio marinus TaxID=2164132 RepID=UPI000E0C639F|nr:hypothetical protein [Pleomorphovibrio marinus]
MKKIAYFLSVLMLFTVTMPYATAKDDKDKPELSKEDEARLEELKERVHEIKAMEFSTMTKTEKKEIRNELREINKETKRVSGGVYISFGAIIIILLILILFT